MKFISYVFSLLLISTIVVANETTPQFPHKDFKIKFTYKLDNGSTIYVEPTGVNDAIWELNRRTGLFTKKAIVWNFIDTPILAYLASPKKTRTRRMSLKFNQRQMSILNSQ